MKVVYNACYGGFSLSDAAITRYWEIKGGVPTPNWYNRDIPRDDPALVQVVEELGDNADGSFANLTIDNIPSGARWRIDEYDGFETVRTIDDYEWHTAT